jgi:hypothetical protein
MKTPAYSSLTAFLAHHRALASARTRSADDELLFTEMSAVLNTLPPDELSALTLIDDKPASRRHRERAELHLRRELIARGIIAG